MSRSLVPTFVGLKLRLLRNTLRRPEGKGLVTFTILAAILATAVSIWAHNLSAQERLVVTPLLTTIVILGWWLAPLLLGVGDETIDTTRLAPFALSARALAPAMIAAALVGPGALAILTPLLALASTAPTLVGKALGVLAAFVTVALGAVSSRWLATVLGGFLRRRRARDLATVSAGLAAGVMGLALQGLISSGQGPNLVGAARGAHWLRWLPTGWSGDALGRASTGEILVPLLEVVAAALALAAISWSWIRVLAAALVDAADGLDEDHEAESLLLRRPGPTALLLRADQIVGTVASKEQRYLRRHPRYRVQVLTQATVLLIGGAPFLSAIASRDPRAVLLGCIPGLTAGVTGSNLLGSDGRSLWGEYLALPSLRPLLRGRALTFAAVGVGLSIALTFFVAAWTGGWRYAPAALGAAVGMALAGSGIGSITSTIAPTPFPDDDSPNPFATSSPGSGCLNAIGTFAGVLVGLAVAVPILYALSQARHDELAIVMTTVAAPAYGLAVWLMTTRLAGRRADRVAPRLMAAMDGI